MKMNKTHFELYHYNHNHDALGRFAKSPSTAIYDKAVKKEPKISKDVTSAIKSNNGSIYGFKNRLKTKKSIERKSKSKEVKDAVRYTAILSENSFVNDYNGIKKDLSKKGYKETRCKNYFEEYKKGKVNHKSVQSNFQDNEGYVFEIQFQTKASQKVKDKKVPLYEEVRNPKTSTKRKGEIIVEMKLMADSISDPYNISKIKSH